ncbi:serine/threonine-protein kinase [Agromyces sp. G08B096]|uniref:non-specific serine/threonine protein kinase n=1 Tax=Agromyces sp. G08B096 TaxID=3156399 RepID=A0AAU7W6L0_9MICO
MTDIATQGFADPPPVRSGDLAGEGPTISGGLPGDVPAGFGRTDTPLAPLTTPITQPVPTFVGRYAIRELIGAGGMADVYLATDTQLGRDVAVKLFRAEQDTPADRLRREREIQLLGDLTHLGLVGIYDAGFLGPEEAGRRFIVMELVRGRSLAQRLARGPLKPRQVADVGAQIADALAYIHTRSVVHRDVKPENILLSDEPAYGYTLTAKLADFGVAQFIDGTRLTGDGSIMGTAAYISPEQARGAEAGPASDVYSLGLVMLEAFSGEREYSGTPIEAALARLHRPPTIPEELPEDWQDLIAAMTADDPDARPTAHDVAAIMRESIHDMAAASGPRRGSAARGGSARRRGSLWPFGGTRG